MKRILTVLFLVLSASLVSAADYTFSQVRNFQNALTGTDEWYWLPTIVIENTSASSQNFVLSWAAVSPYYQTKSGALTGANWSINGSTSRSVTVAAGATYTVPYNGTFWMQHQVSLNSGTGGISGGAWRMSPLGSVVTGIETESIGLYRNSVNSTNLCDAVTAQVDVYYKYYSDGNLTALSQDNLRTNNVVYLRYSGTTGTSNGYSGATRPGATEPTIITQPQSFTAAAGTSHTFSVVAQNATSYLWGKKVYDGVQYIFSSIPGATNSTYTAIAGADGTSEEYACMVSNSLGSVDSDWAVYLSHTNSGTSTPYQYRIVTINHTGKSGTFNVVDSTGTRVVQIPPFGTSDSGNVTVNSSPYTTVTLDVNGAKAVVTPFPSYDFTPAQTGTNRIAAFGVQVSDWPLSVYASNLPTAQGTVTTLTNMVSTMGTNGVITTEPTTLQTFTSSNTNYPSGFMASDANGKSSFLQGGTNVSYTVPLTGENASGSGQGEGITQDQVQAAIQNALQGSSPSSSFSAPAGRTNDATAQGAITSANTGLTNSMAQASYLISNIPALPSSIMGANVTVTNWPIIIPATSWLPSGYTMNVPLNNFAVHAIRQLLLFSFCVATVFTWYRILKV